jgi:O-antigen ligase
LSGRARAAAVLGVLALATWGEGGASAPSLLATHLVLAAAVGAAVLALPCAGTRPAGAPAAAWVVFAVLAGASAAIAPYAYAAWLVVVEIIAFGSMVWLAAGAPAALTAGLPPVIALLATAHGVAATAQKLGGASRPASTFLNPNHLGSWLAAGTLIVASRALDRGTPPRARVAYGLASVCALSGIFVTGSRGALLALAAGAGVLALAAARRAEAQVRRRIIAAATAIVLVGAAGVALRFRTDADPYRFHRTKIWAAVAAAAMRKPWLGLGPGQLAAAAPNMNFPLTDAALSFERGFSTPHSDLLRAVAELGIPAAVAAILAAVLAVRHALRRRDPESLPVGVLAALAGLGAQCAVDDLTVRPAITMLIAASAGILIAERRESAAGAWSRATAAAAAGLVVLALGVGEVEGYLAWDAMRALPTGPLDPVQLARLRRALSLNPMLPAAWQRLSEHAIGDGRSWTLAGYATAREAAEEARRLQPMDAAYAKGAARVEATAALSILPFEGTRARAATLYDEAGSLARTDATIPLEAARFLLQAGDAPGARREARRALEVEPRAAAPRLLLAQAILADEGTHGAAEARQLLDEARTLRLPPGVAPTSSYDAALRAVDPRALDAAAAELDRAAGR